MSTHNLPSEQPKEIQSKKGKSRILIGILIGLITLTIIGVIRFFPNTPTREVLEVVHRSELTLTEGRLYRIGNTVPFTGVLVEHFEEGSLQSRSEVLDGKLHGLSEGWHSNGQVAVRENFREGISHGLRTKWYPTGAKLSEASIENGQLHGVFRRWHENGVLAEQVEMVLGVPEGISRAYYPSGSLKAEAMMEGDRALKQVFYQNG